MRLAVGRFSDGPRAPDYWDDRRRVKQQRNRAPAEHRTLNDEISRSQSSTKTWLRAAGTDSVLGAHARRPPASARRPYGGQPIPREACVPCPRVESIRGVFVFYSRRTSPPAYLRGGRHRPY